MGVVRFVFAQKQYDMRVRQPTFLVFDGVDVAGIGTEDVLELDVMQHFFKLQIENPSDQIRAICRLLTGEEFPSNLGSLGVGGESNE